MEGDERREAGFAHTRGAVPQAVQREREEAALSGGTSKVSTRAGESPTGDFTCAIQKAEVNKIEQWVSYDRSAKAPTLATNLSKLAVANASLKRCRDQTPATIDLSARNYQAEFDGLQQLVAISYHVADGDVRISYRYDGKFGNYNTADTALAFLNGQKIATATTVSLQGRPGEFTQVHETHFAGDGTVIYEGDLSFFFGGCVKLEAERPLAGTRRYRIFTQWPLEAGAMLPCPF